MASIARDKNGTRRLLFVLPNGDRKAIRLGAINQKAAETIKTKVENLLAFNGSHCSWDNETAKWVGEIGDELAEKLANVGLIPSRAKRESLTLGERELLTLGKHLDGYFAKRTDVKPNTLTHWNHTKRLLLAYFGTDRPLASVTVGDARDFERWLKTSAARENRYADREASDGLAPNTLRKRVSNAKQFFQDAVERELITRNPFAAMKGTAGGNRERDYFLSRDDAAKILNSCPDAEWRLIFALSRFGGLRCPSEHLALKWGDVNWVENKMLVRSSKTEHHEGKATRLVPIFPELRPYLEDARELAERDAEFVITRHRTVNANLRTQLERIVRKAGLKTWPKLFQNLRASRATELANEYPAHVAAAWLGHTTAVASRHYWQVTDADFEKATAIDSPIETMAPKAAQNCAQQTAASTAHGLASEKSAHEKTLVLPGFAKDRELLRTLSMGVTGHEQSSVFPLETQDSTEGGAKLCAFSADLVPDDEQLAELLGAWPDLSDDVKAALLSIVRGEMRRSAVR